MPVAGGGGGVRMVPKPPKFLENERETKHSFRRTV